MLETIEKSRLFLIQASSQGVCMCCLQSVARQGNRRANSKSGFANLSLKVQGIRSDRISYRVLPALNQKTLGTFFLSPWDLILLLLLELHSLVSLRKQKNHLLSQRVTGLVTPFPITVSFSYCISTSLV